MPGINFGGDGPTDDKAAKKTIFDAVKGNEMSSEHYESKTNFKPETHGKDRLKTVGLTLGTLAVFGVIAAAAITGYQKFDSYVNGLVDQRYAARQVEKAKISGPTLEIGENDTVKFAVWYAKDGSPPIIKASMAHIVSCMKDQKGAEEARAQYSNIPSGTVVTCVRISELVNELNLSDQHTDNTGKSN